MTNYNATCFITGRKDNLRMYAHRNEYGDMVGWVFVHESVAMEYHKITITLEKKSEQELNGVETGEQPTEPMDGE